MDEHDEHIRQCQECSRNKAIADSIFVVDSDILDEVESRDPKPYAPFVERLKSLATNEWHYQLLFIFESYNVILIGKKGHKDK